MTSLCPRPKIQCPGKKLVWNYASSYILPCIFINKLQLSKKKKNSFWFKKQGQFFSLSQWMLVASVEEAPVPLPMSLWVKGPGQGKVKSPCLGCSSLSQVRPFGISFICQPSNVAADTSLLRLNWMHSPVGKINITGLLLQSVIPSGFIDHPLSRNLVDVRSTALWWEVLLYYSFLVSAFSAKLLFHPSCGFGFQLVPNTKIDVYRCLSLWSFCFALVP